MKSKQMLSALLVGLLLCSTGCQNTEEPTDDTAEEQQAPQGTAVEVQSVVSGEMSTEYSLTGKVVAGNEVQVFPLLAGEVTSLAVSEGDTITNGQLLFTVDTDTVTSTMGALQQSYSATKNATDRAIEQAQAGVRSAETGVESANTSVTTANSGIDAAQATVDSAQAAVESAQATMDSAQAAVDNARTSVESAQASVESARAGLQSAEASAEAAQAGAEASEAQLAAAQIGVESAQTALDNATAMYEAGAGAEQDVINAERGLRQAETTLAQAQAAAKQVQAQQQQAQAGLQQAQAAVQQAELGVEQAQNALKQAESGLKQAESGKKQAESGYQQALVGLEQAQASSDQAQTGLKQAQAAVQQAQAASGQARAQQSASLAQIQANMDQINSQARLGTVYAPCAGTVTAVNLTRGSVAASSQPAVVIAEDGKVEIQVSVAEDVFTNIHAGDNAGVVISVLGDEMFEGTIDTLPAAANVQTNLYDVSVLLPADVTPPIGAFATVTFYTDRRSNTLQIPTESILTGNNNEQFVFIVDDDAGGETAKRIPVETGLVSKTNTEILSGLQEGDRVIVKGQSYLSDGSSIRIVETYTGSGTSDTSDTDAADSTGGETGDATGDATGSDETASGNATDADTSNAGASDILTGQTNPGGSSWEANTSLVVDENGEG